MERSVVAESSQRVTSNPSEYSIRQALEAYALRFPDNVAIVAPGRPALTFAAFYRQVEQTINALDGAGIRGNDCVAMVLPDGPEAAVAFTSVAAAAMCAPLNPRFKYDEFDCYLALLRAKALVVKFGVDSVAVAIAQKRGLPVFQLTPVVDAAAGIFTLNINAAVPATGPSDSDRESRGLVLLTSGTTSRSKLVPLTEANIFAAAHAIQQALQISSNDRYLNVSHLFYSQGVMLSLASLLSGASVACPTSFDAGHFFQWLQELQPTWYSAAPTIHRAILIQAPAYRDEVSSRRLRLIRSAAAPLPAKIHEELEAVFGAPVIESYGMTECYPITCNPLPPGKRVVGAAGIAAGAEVTILDDAGHSLSPGEIGEIGVCAPQMMRGYLNDPEANRCSFVDRWFRTGDLGYLDGDGYLYITGRVKEIINRGGEKISPREVDEVLLEHAAVAEAVTFPVPHPTLLEDIAAAVVLRQPGAVTAGQLREFASARLADFKIPRQVLIVGAIPKTATGKVQRAGLAEYLGLLKRPGLKKHRTMRHSSAEHVIAKLWASVLGLAFVSLHDNFFDLGGHSLVALQMLSQVERLFGKTLPLAALLQAPTVAQLASMLREEVWSDFSGSLIPIQPHGSKPPFFWVHGDESNLLLPRYIAHDQPLYVLMHQAEDGSAARFTSVETIAAHYLEQIRSVQRAGGYFIGGYSFGGTIAFEIAQQLTQQGERVDLLLLVDPRFPGIDVGDVVLLASVELNLRKRLRNLVMLARRERILHERDRHILQVKGRIGALKGWVSDNWKRKVGTVYLALGYRLPISFRSRYMLDIYRCARVNYIPKPYAGAVLYIKSEKRDAQHQQRWRQLMRGGMDLIEIPGGHSDMIRNPYLGLWADKLQGWLDRAREATSVVESQRNESGFVSSPIPTSADLENNVVCTMEPKTGGS